MEFESSWNHERQMKGGGQFAKYVYPLLAGQDFSPFDPMEVVRKIEIAVSDFFKQDYLAIVNLGTVIWRLSEKSLRRVGPSG